MKHGTARYWMVLACGLGLLAGCGEAGKKVKTVDVSGTVFLDEKPLEGVTVFFLTKEHVGFGKTGPDGRYQLGEGAKPGENKVYFSKPEGGEAGPEAADPALAEPTMDAEGATATPAQAIPAKYADSMNPPFTFTVPEAGSTSADFKLTSQ